MKSARKTLAGILVATLLAAMMVLGSTATAPEADAARPGISCVPDGDGSCEFRCSGRYSKALFIAKLSYWASCGETWDHDSGFHKCAWSSAGWQCWERLSGR